MRVADAPNFINTTFDSTQTALDETIKEFMGSYNFRMACCKKKKCCKKYRKGEHRRCNKCPKRI